MKALTVRQPWASLIILGDKDIENRSWPTKHRGLIAIHAAKAVTPAELHAGREMCEKLEIPFPETLPTSAILGVVNMIGHVWKDEAGEYFTDSGLEDTNLDWHNDDSIGWLLTDPRAIDPISCKGALGLWNLPEEIAAELERRLRGK